jgi:hypothetical protein
MNGLRTSGIIYNGILFSHKEEWMEMENFTLIEVSQVHKAKSCMFSLICRI